MARFFNRAGLESFIADYHADRLRRKERERDARTRREGGTEGGTEGRREGGREIETAPPVPAVAARAH